LAKGILSAIVERLLESALGEARRSLEAWIGRRISEALRAMALGVLGALISALGMAFVCVGIAKYLGAFLPAWQSWILVGALAILLGLLLALASYALIKR
jgi:hypothetical protein